MQNSATIPLTVLFVQRRLPHYRVSFFEALYKELALRGCRLRLAYGTANRIEDTRHDSAELAWAEKLPTHYFLNGHLCWQPFYKQMKDADLVICSHENKLLFNLIAQYFYPQTKFALFGHGANLQGLAGSWKERFKRIAAGRADWWFAYTSLCLPLLQRFNFPEQRITVINNSVDTRELAFLYSRISFDERRNIRARLGLNGRHTGIFIGSFYHEKRIDFLLQALLLIKQRLPDFEMLLVGDGIQKQQVIDFCKENSWAQYMGLCKGKAKADLLAVSGIMLNPGLVGLGILDSFICAVPMLTTDCGLHSPEIAYMEQGINGVMTHNSAESYVSAVVDLFNNPDELSRMKKACLQSSRDYSIENMAGRFADGIMACLQAPDYRGGRG